MKTLTLTLRHRDALICVLDHSPRPNSDGRLFDKFLLNVDLTEDECTLIGYKKVPYPGSNIEIGSWMANAPELRDKTVEVEDETAAKILSVLRRWPLFTKQDDSSINALAVQLGEEPQEPLRRTKRAGSTSADPSKQQPRLN